LPEFAVIVLAAGESSRMGSPKQLLEFRGKPLIRHAVETALASGCTAVVVVLGAHAAVVRAALDGVAAGSKIMCFVGNPRWAEGMGSSIQAGLAEAVALGVEGVVLALADQPMVTPEMLDWLVGEHTRTGLPIVASRYSGTVGVPVYFAKERFAALQALAPDQGCKGVILKGGESSFLVDCPAAAVDVDTPGDYAAVAERA
jgi:molybdenum cofactor cytidylyltransferase